MKKLTLIITLAALGSTACSYHARSAEKYRDATQELLLTKQTELQACYDEVLKVDKAAGGTVQVNFKVEAETGKIVDTKLDPNGTTAPAPLGECVVKTIDGLALTPPDANDGMATFTYDFQVNQPAT